MSTHVLFSLITVQVAVFQFLSFRMSWSLPKYLVGVERLPPEVSGAVSDFRRRGRRLRYGLGSLLLLGSVLSTFVLDLSTAQTKLVLAAISIVSSLALVLGLMLDRTQMLRLATKLPEVPLRSAVLERRQLGQYYPVWLEGIPVAVLVTVVAASFWVVLVVPASWSALLGVWTVPLVLSGLVGGGWILSRRLALSGCRVPQKTRAFLPSAENSIRVGESLMGLELRCFMAGKIGIAILLAVWQVERLAEFAGSDVPPAVELLQWLLPAALLGLFAVYILRLSKLSGFKTQGGEDS